MCFPRLKSRGPIEAILGDLDALSRMGFPRLKSRGPIDRLDSHIEGCSPPLPSSPPLVPPSVPSCSPLLRADCTNLHPHTPQLCQAGIGDQDCCPAPRKPLVLARRSAVPFIPSIGYGDRGARAADTLERRETSPLETLREAKRRWRGRGVDGLDARD